MPYEADYLELANSCIATHKLAVEHGNAKVIAASEVMLFVVGQMIGSQVTEQGTLTVRTIPFHA